MREDRDLLQWGNSIKLFQLKVCYCPMNATESFESANIPSATMKKSAISMVYVYICMRTNTILVIMNFDHYRNVF